MQNPDTGLESSPQQELNSNEDLLHKALSKIDAGKFSAAAKDLKQILSNDPYDEQAIYWQGYCFQCMGDAQNALKCFKTLSHLAPGEESFTNLGHHYYHMGKDSEALEAYQKALDEINYESPHLFSIYKNIGNIHVRSGDYDSAEDNYNKAHAIYSNSDVLYVNYGTLEIQKGNFDLARERFAEATRINQLNDSAWAGIAMIARQKADKDLAWANLNLAIECNPYNLTALQLSVVWGLQDGDYGATIEYLESYLNKFPDNEDISFSLASLLYQAGRYDEAKVELVRTLSLNPKREDALQLKQLVREVG